MGKNMNMNIKSFVACILLGAGNHVTEGKIQVMCTAALIKNSFEVRQREYVRSLQVLKNYGYEPYVAEAICPKGPTFLDNYSRHVCYSNVNNAKLRNKGVNEARSMMVALRQFNFDDNDIIVKLTGRHAFTSDAFFKTIQNNPEVDAFVLYSDQYGNIPTICFALRCNYFKDMLLHLDLAKMERQMINIEAELNFYVQKMQKLGMKVMYLHKMGTTGFIFGNPGVKPTPWEM